MSPIWRVFPRRNTGSRHLRGSPLTLRLALLSEDNSLTADGRHELRARLLESSTGRTSSATPEVAFLGGEYEVCLRCSLDPGLYRLRVEPSPAETELVLGFTSCDFEVVDPGEGSPLPASPMLSWYREVSLPRGPVLLREDYGAALGSHLWDAGYVLAGYLAGLDDPIEGAVVELGAGCGLVGLSLRREGTRVILTDRSPLASLIKHNIAINGAESSCEYCELEWANEAHVGSVLSSSGGAVDFVVAADVLYDLASIEPLVRLIRRLDPRKAVFIAQKLRAASDRALDRCQRLLPEMSWEAVHQSFDVKVWRLETQLLDNFGLR